MIENIKEFKMTNKQLNLINLSLITLFIKLCTYSLQCSLKTFRDIVEFITNNWLNLHFLFLSFKYFVVVSGLFVEWWVWSCSEWRRSWPRLPNITYGWTSYPPPSTPQASRGRSPLQYSLCSRYPTSRLESQYTFRPGSVWTDQSSSEQQIRKKPLFFKHINIL